MSIRYFTCNCHTNPDTICRHDNDPFNARRMRTDWTIADFNGLSESQVQAINESNQRYNDLVEDIEEMNMAIAMRQIDDGTYEQPVVFKTLEQTTLWRDGKSLQDQTALNGFVSLVQTLLPHKCILYL